MLLKQQFLSNFGMTSDLLTEKRRDEKELQLFKPFQKTLTLWAYLEILNVFRESELSLWRSSPGTSNGLWVRNDSEKEIYLLSPSGQYIQRTIVMV